MKSKSNNPTNEVEKNELVYPASVLLKSKALADYQKDFAKVILGDGEYTVEGAKAALDAELKKED